MTSTDAIALLDKFRNGKISRDKVLQTFQAAPVADLGFAQVDSSAEIPSPSAHLPDL